MSGDTVAKRQKVSHSAARPTAPPKKPAVQEDEVEEPSSSSDAEDPDVGQSETAEEDVPKTFKDLVRASMMHTPLLLLFPNNLSRAW